jgi:hypothetical protein
MTDKWVVTPEHPEGQLVPYTPAEEAAHSADVAAWAAAEATADQREANYEAMRQSLTDRMQQALDLAAKLDANTATAAEQRQALSLLLRGTVRLTRVVFSLLDQAA